MASLDTYPAFSAFEKQLRTLCLREFPCGPGTWKETKTKNLQLLKTKENVDGRFFVTLKDYGAQHEKTETLEEYVGSKHSPWHLDYSWSAEAKQLRELAVKSPWLIDDNFVFNYFKTLRIVDKNVTEVDGDLLKFQQLEELTLSANRIITVNSKNLPSNLKVLELCANQISDISALCVRPPPIIHMGLGFNKISFIGDYLTGDFWPCMLSLDLSHNNLSDLLDVVRKLGTLPKLRNLVLQGNPLSLIPGYRGYMIDSLRKLNILDDIMISADERHHYKGLARRREHILDEAKVTLEVTYIKGVPMPEELKNPEEQPEFPKIERNYFVQFMFLQDTSPPKSEMLHITHDDFCAMSQPPSTDRSQVSHKTNTIAEVEERSVSQQSQATETVKNVNFTSEPEFASAREPTADHERPPDEVPPSATPKTDDGNLDQSSNTLAPPTIHIEPLKSGAGNWAEEIELNWSQVVVRDDLLALRNFFKKGMEFSVIEEMVELTPLEDEEGEIVKPSSAKSDKKVLLTPNEDTSEPTTPTKNKGKEAKKKDDKKEEKKDEKKDDKKDKGGGKDKGGKKKKEPEVEMKRSIPTYTTLATWHIPLEEFLEGEYQFQSVFQKGSVEVASTVRSADIKKDKDKKKPGSSKPKDVKGGKGSAASRSSRNSRSSGPRKLILKKTEGRRPSAVGAKGGGKDDKKTNKDKGVKGAPPVAEEEEEAPPPPPLETQIRVRLHHWKTAVDSLKEEQEKAQPEPEAEQT